MNAYPHSDTHFATKDTPLFSIGTVMATPGALDLLDRAGVNATAYLVRHQHGDFGSLSDFDARQNDFAICNGLRIFSSYDVELERLWIITEANRAATTLLLPSEY